jgi:HAD superfamily hydrolase (TIGR01459 family)
MIPIHKTLAELVPRYDVLLCDVWGVLHNGVAAFPAAVTALARAREAGATVVLVTNAPRPAGPVQQQLSALGVIADAYDAIATSGDVTRALVEAQGGQPIFHLGTDRDTSLYQGLNVQLAPAEKAVAVVCTGLLDDLHETPVDYEDRLQALARRGLPFICANPDLVVERGAQLCYCAGALAARYTELGGTVTYAGKPHRPIYERAIALATSARGGRTPDPQRILAIGDGLSTDMAGAKAFGVDALFIPSAVSMPDGGTDIEAPFKPLGMLPVAAMWGLAWPEQG